MDSESSHSFATTLTSVSMILLCFFIYLNAISTVNTERSSRVLSSVQHELGVRPVGTRPALTTPLTTHSLADIEALLREAELKARKDGDSLVVTLPQREVFVPGGDQIAAKAVGLFNGVIAQAMAEDVEVEIASSLLPTTQVSGAFASPLDLAIARAGSLYRLLLDGSIEAERISVFGRIGDDELVEVRFSRLDSKRRGAR